MIMGEQGYFDDDDDNDEYSLGRSVDLGSSTSSNSKRLVWTTDHLQTAIVAYRSCGRLKLSVDWDTGGADNLLRDFNKYGTLSSIKKAERTAVLCNWPGRK